MSANRFLFQGCKSGAKWSSGYVSIPKGEATGKLECRSNSQVLKIEHDKSGKVDGVVYADKDGKIHKQRARIVCVAGNSIESPRLLLNSESNMFKNGMANSSGQVGRNYMRHMTASTYAIFENQFISTVEQQWQVSFKMKQGMIQVVVS